MTIPRWTLLPSMIPNNNSILIQIPIVLFLLNTTSLLTSLLTLLFLTNIPRTPNSRQNRSRPLHLLTSHQIPRTQHPDIVPPLHHILMTPRPKTPSVLTSSPPKPETLEGTRFDGSQTVFAAFDVEFMRFGGDG